MVRINKVYTKKGDKGETSLGGGVRVQKDSSRVEAYGTVDELNSVIGITRYFNLQKEPSVRRDKLELILRSIQQRLFDMGSELATSPEKSNKNPCAVTEENVHWLEQVIDEMNVELKPLPSFVLPGGGPVNSFLHQCRTVCRRAEREILRLSRQEEVNPSVLAYINRLSDAFFVFGRWVGSTLGEEEFLWEPVSSDPTDWRWK